ncbi:hypothetical protein F4802DRAFT_327193 [Xylaria palmicola]|nr:hypothetical protein F4802DRAFT_327193 [Xylaria palmicola]
MKGDIATRPRTRPKSHQFSIDRKATDPAATDMSGGELPSTHLLGDDNGSFSAQQRKMPDVEVGTSTLVSSRPVAVATSKLANDASVSSAQAQSSLSPGEGTAMIQGPKRSFLAATSNGNGLDEKPAVNIHGADLGVHKDQWSSVQNGDGPRTEILPYVIEEERAYRLPISLQLIRGDKHSTFPEHELAMELAFLSPGQLHTLQRLLQYHSETGPKKLIRLEVARKPGRKFWQRRRQATVAFVEGDASSAPEFLLSQDDASRHAENTTLMQPIQKADQERPPSRIGLPNFQDVTRDLIHDLHAPWSRNSDREQFTEYRVWHIEPYSTFDAGGSSTKDWTRSLLKEEILPRVEIKRRLRTLDKGTSTVLEKSAMLTLAQQYQLWRSIEAAKLGDSDPDYQWSLRQLEIVRSRRLFFVKQVKAIIVYVSKAPRLLHDSTLEDQGSVKDLSPKNSLRTPQTRVDTGDTAISERPTTSRTRSAVDSGVARGTSSLERQDNWRLRGESHVNIDVRNSAETPRRRDEAIAQANSVIANRPKPSPARRQTSITGDDNSDTKYELAKGHNRDREEELVRKIARLELEMKKREREQDDKQTRSGTVNDAQREIRPERRNKKTAEARKPARPQSNQGVEQHEDDSDGPYIIDARDPTPRRGVKIFDRRSAVEQLLLEWTPAHIRGDGKEVNGLPLEYLEAESASDSGSEIYVMAEETPATGLSPAPVRKEHAGGGQSTVRVSHDQWSVEEVRKGENEAPPLATDDAGGPQDAAGRDEEKVADDDIILRSWGTSSGGKDVVSSGPQQRFQPANNGADGPEDQPQEKVPRTNTSGADETREIRAGTRWLQKGKVIVRASTLPHASRQPWLSEDWARQVMEETAETAEDGIRLDRSHGRRASFQLA